VIYEQLAKTVRIESRKHMIGRFYCHCGEDEPFAPFTEEDAKSVPMNTTNACRGVLQDKKPTVAKMQWLQRGHRDILPPN